MSTSLVENLAVTACLHDRHAHFLLILADVATDFHALGEQLDEFIVEHIYFVSVVFEFVGVLFGVAEDEARHDEVEHFRCHLLRRITPSLIGIAVAFDHEAVQAHIHRLLAERSNQVATSADVARVANHGQLRKPTLQFDWDLPHRLVAVQLLFVAAEAPVDCAKLLYAGTIDAQQRAYPQLEVWVDRILDEDRRIGAFQRICQCLYGKGIGCSACSDPEDVDAMLEGQLDVFRRGNFRSSKHARFLLDAFHPGECWFAVPFEASGLCSRLPDAGTEYVAAFAS